MAYNIADLFEYTVDAVPGRTALITERGGSLTFAELDARANRFGHFLTSQGIGEGDHVGIYAVNSEPWVTAMLGCLKVRAVPINVNYRYVEAELAYLIGNAELVACVFDQEYAPRLAAVRDRYPRRHADPRGRFGGTEAGIAAGDRRGATAVRARAR